MSLFLVRLGSEIATKARHTRRRFTHVLATNIRDALDALGVDHRVDPRWSRIYVEASDDAALERIASVFGVSSVSLVEGRVPADLDGIVRTGAETFGDRVRGHRYAVEARRDGKYAFSSQDVRVELGRALNPGATVDLDHPEITVSVEVRDGEAYLYSGKTVGVGGLPLGVEGKAVCLISGGFDSAVAAWLMLKRGVALEYVFCNLGGEAYERAVVSVAKVLGDGWSFGDRPRLHAVDFAAVVSEMQRTVQPKYWQVVLKRLMYRAAEALGREIGADAIVTGESVGQVSSQTLANLRAIDEVATLPVFRPLVGFDKEEIIRQAERIGTAVLSKHIREYCAIVPEKPVTHAAVHAAADEESHVDLAVLDHAVAQRRTLDLRALEAVDLVQPYLFTDKIVAEAVVLDCREAHHFRHWHYPGAERIDLDRLAGGFHKFDKQRTYVLYCAFGVQTAYVAELMQRHGYDAYSFRGGVKALQQYVSRESGIGNRESSS